MLRKYGTKRIGSYSNFNRYVTVNKLKQKAKSQGHPKFEKNPGEQAQVDWKEDIHITNIYGEVFIINVLHTTLKYSRYAHLEMTAQKDSMMLQEDLLIVSESLEVFQKNYF